MDDLISREDALKALDEMSYKSPHESATSVVRKKHFGEILEKFIMQQPSAQPEQAKYVPDTKAIPSSRDCVDLSERVTATFYDVEHEEWSQKTVTIQDVLDSVCDEYTVLPSAQQWIPCSERLPDSQEDVLCDDDGRVTIGYYTDEEIGWHDTHSYRIYPTAWMPLPSPYNGDEDG